MNIENSFGLKEFKNIWFYHYAERGKDTEGGGMGFFERFNGF